MAVGRGCWGCSADSFHGMQVVGRNGVGEPGVLVAPVKADAIAKRARSIDGQDREAASVTQANLACRFYVG